MRAVRRGWKGLGNDEPFLVLLKCKATSKPTAPRTKVIVKGTQNEACRGKGIQDLWEGPIPTCYIRL